MILTQALPPGVIQRPAIKNSIHNDSLNICYILDTEVYKTDKNPYIHRV